jgi:hypothetical protein
MIGENKYKPTVLKQNPKYGRLPERIRFSWLTYLQNGSFSRFSIDDWVLGDVRCAEFVSGARVSTRCDVADPESKTMIHSFSHKDLGLR